jgi:hypothetical protein
VGSSPTTSANGVIPNGKVPALGAGKTAFDSLYPDQRAECSFPKGFGRDTIVQFAWGVCVTKKKPLVSDCSAVW